MEHTVFLTPKHPNMKIYEGVEKKLYSFSTSILDG
jgi:hypothetical protein